MKKILQPILPDVLTKLNDSESCTSESSVRRGLSMVGQQAVVDVLE